MRTFKSYKIDVYRIMFCAKVAIRGTSVLSVTFVIFLDLVRRSWGWLLVRCVPLFPWPSRLRSSPALSENPPEHRATPILLGTKRNYTRGLSAVFVFPFFPVSFRSLARGGRWTTEAGRNQPKRAKSRRQTKYHARKSSRFSTFHDQNTRSSSQGLVNEL